MAANSDAFYLALEELIQMRLFAMEAEARGIDQGLRVLDAETDGKRLGFQEHAARVQHFEGIARAVPDGEDWSSEHSEAALVAHVRERVDHYLSEAVVSTVVDEFNRLERELSA